MSLALIFTAEQWQGYIEESGCVNAANSVGSANVHPAILSPESQLVHKYDATLNQGLRVKEWYFKCLFMSVRKGHFTAYL